MEATFEVEIHQGPKLSDLHWIHDAVILRSPKGHTSCTFILCGFQPSFSWLLASIAGLLRADERDAPEPE